MAREWIERLISEQRITINQLSQARQVARQRHLPLEAVLVELGFVSDDRIRVYQTLQFEPERIDLENRLIAPEVIEQIPASVARENCVIPVLFTDNLLTVAISTPVVEDVVDKLCFIIPSRIRLVSASRDAIASAIERHYPPEEQPSPEEMCVLTEFVSPAVLFTPPVIDKMLRLFLQEAMTLGSQSVQWEAAPTHTRIFYCRNNDEAKLERDSLRATLYKEFCRRLLARAQLVDPDINHPIHGTLATSIHNVDHILPITAEMTEFGWTITIELPTNEVSRDLFL